jgi:hypothetical protein
LSREDKETGAVKPGRASERERERDQTSSSTAGKKNSETVEKIWVQTAQWEFQRARLEQSSRN